jgi:hypothetical protein
MSPPSRSRRRKRHSARGYSLLGHAQREGQDDPRPRGRTRFEYAGAREAAIRDLFGESSTRFYHRLNAILDDPAALAYNAVLVNRLRRLRDLRQRQRHAVKSVE